MFNDRMVSRYTPNIVGHWTISSCESSMSILGCDVAWCVSGQNNVTEDFGEEINKELSFRHTVISCRYLVRLSSRSGILTYVAHTVRSPE